MQIDYRNDISDLLNGKNYKIGIEVGSYEGEFSRIILSKWDGILYSLDVWLKLDDDEYVDSSNKSPYDTLYKVIDNVGGYEDRSVLIRTNSEYGSKIFPNEFFDFVYIDANHKYEYVKNDIDYWYLKVKKGGMLSGHDYIDNFTKNTNKDIKDNHVWVYTDNDKINQKYCGLFGVNHAVDEFVEKHNKELYVTKEYFGTWYIFK